VTSTATPAPAPLARPTRGASPRRLTPTATLATGTIAEISGSVISGRPAWYAVCVSRMFAMPATITA
jgi:hypothetical protein